MSMLKGRVFLKILPRPPFIETVESSTDILYRTELKSEVPDSNGIISLGDAITRKMLEIENSRDAEPVVCEVTVSDVIAEDTTQSSVPPDNNSNESEGPTSIVS